MRKIATWNVNSIKVRLPHLLAWLKHAEPDVVCLQELKCQDEGFPAMEIAAAGYKALVFGQKSYNGVAILARGPLTERRRGLPGDASDEQARYLEAEVGGLVVASIYLPNGNPVESEKFPYKLKWMTRLRSHARHLLAEEKLVVLAGDYNAIPEAIDCHDPVAWRKDALFRPETQAAFRALKNDGWTEAFRTLHPDKRAYSFWDYQAGAWQNDHGIRIDHLLLSPQAADRLEACEIEKQQRAREKASDHVPVWCSLKD